VIKERTVAKTTRLTLTQHLR